MIIGPARPKTQFRVSLALLATSALVGMSLAATGSTASGQAFTWTSDPSALSSGGTYSIRDVNLDFSNNIFGGGNSRAVFFSPAIFSGTVALGTQSLNLLTFQYINTTSVTGLGCQTFACRTTVVITPFTNQVTVQRTDSLGNPTVTLATGSGNGWLVDNISLLRFAPQLSGEGGHGAMQTTAFTAANLFLNTIVDSATEGRVGGSGPIAFAEEDQQALAYASKAERDARKATTPRNARIDRDYVFAPRWTAWAAGYGGSANVEGDAAAGTSKTTRNIAGTAVGADYRFGRDAMVGFALGGGGTRFSTAQGLGDGRADLFQIGVYGRRNVGTAYIAGALAYGWQGVAIDRTVSTERLRADFNANTFAARAEAGYRFPAAVMGVTPYGALQVTSARLPGYAEYAASGSSLYALSFASQSETNLRSELGVRGDKSFIMNGGVLTLRSRLAWAHDTNTERFITPTFQSLPGAAFTIKAATPSADGALLTVGADLKWHNGWSVAGMFEGEFSRTTESYGGKIFVKYAW